MFFDDVWSAADAVFFFKAAGAGATRSHRGQAQMIGLLTSFAVWLLGPLEVEPWEEGPMPARKESQSAASQGWDAASCGIRKITRTSGGRIDSGRCWLKCGPTPGGLISTGKIRRTEK
jgi:hypothetical protein